MRRCLPLLLVLVVGCGGGGGGGASVSVSVARVLLATKASLDAQIFGSAIGRGRDVGFFDPYLQLWVTDRSDGAGSDLRFSEDEGGTQPAGFLQKTATRWEYEVTKGPLAGSQGLRTFEGDVARTDLRLVDGAKVHSRRDSASEVGTYTPATGSPVRYTITATKGQWNDDQFSWNLTLPAQGAGTGKLEGPDSRLPATLNLDRYGYGTITWRDGTAIAVDAWVLQTAPSRDTMHENGGRAKR